MKFLSFFLCLLLVLWMSACNLNEEKLPVLRNPKALNDDTTLSKIRSFSFTDQDSHLVTNKTFDDKVYVADFIFLSCPTICPKMNIEMLSAYKEFEQNPHVLFLSHTIDPDNDTIPRLKAYAKNIGVSSDKWHFVTGNKHSIYAIAEKSYFNSVYQDSTDKNNYIHGGGFVLIDKKRFIRGVYDGTSPDETKRLVEDIKTLLKE